MKIPLSVTAGYRPGWGVWQGMREIVQNALDQQDASDQPFRIARKGKRVIISNPGVRLDASVWLLGKTSKAYDPKARGKFGEGLKLACLALIRSGVAVRIVNDDESWTPSIEPSEIYGGAEVLVISTHKLQSSRGAFEVTIEPIGDEDWDTFQSRVLSLRKPAAKDAIHVPSGRVLLARPGAVFCKGLFVTDVVGLQYGYDLESLELDVDRKMADPWSFNSALARVWSEVIAAHPDKVDLVTGMLEAQATDVRELHWYANTALQGALADKFRETYKDETAVPVLSLAEARELEHLGLQGVIVSKPHKELLEKTMGTLDARKASAGKTARRIVQPCEFTTQEKDALRWALGLLEPVAKELGHPAVEARTIVVEFGDKGLLGLHEDGDVKLARAILSDRAETLRVLVHEVAHDVGGDGEKSHERREGKLFARIAQRLAERLEALTNTTE
jgi:hypothetical protein